MTFVFIKPRFARSPNGKSVAAKVVATLSTGTDSPVSEASSICNEADSIIRISAGTMSPASKRTTSPVTNSVDLTDMSLPSRITLALGVDISFKALIASSALAS